MRISALFFAPLLAVGVARAGGPDLNVVSKVEVQNKGGAIVIAIEGSRPPSFTTFSMMDPPRFVVDISGSAFKGVPEDVKVEDGTIQVLKNISYGGGDATSMARVMIAFSRDIDPPELETAGTTLFVKIPKPPAARAPIAAAEPAPRAAPADPVPPAAAAVAALATPAVKANADASAQDAAEAKAKAEAERKARAEALAKAEAERKAKVEAEASAKAEATRVAAEKESEARARAEALARAQAEEQARAQAEEQARAQAEEQARAQAEAQAATKAQAEREEQARKDGAAKTLEKARQEQLAAERAKVEEEAKQAEARAVAAVAEREAAKRAEAEEARAASARQAKAAEEAAGREAADRARAEEAARIASAKEQAAKDAAEREEADRARAEEAKLARREAKPRRQHIREVGFQVLANVSRVFVRLSETPRFRIVEARDKLILVEMPNATVMRKNDARFLDTSFFPGAVAMVTPKRQGKSTVLEIALKEKVAYQQRVEGDLLSIDFERPVALKPSAAAPALPAPTDDASAAHLN